jgi:hypothetical protein
VHGEKESVVEPQEAVQNVAEGSSYPGWMAYLALTTIVLAVGATLASFKEGNNSVDSVLNQTQAANQWAYYQSKSIKSYLYEMQRDKLRFDLEEKGETLSPAQMGAYKETVATYSAEIGRYDAEKKEIRNVAQEFEKQRDGASWRAGEFGLAVIFLQMGILLCSIAALMKRKLFWLIGTGIGVVGIVFFTNGYLHFMR